MGRGFPQGTAEGASEGTATDLGSGLGEEGRVGSRCTLLVGNCWEGGLLIEAEVRELRVLRESRISRLLSPGNVEFLGPRAVFTVWRQLVQGSEKSRSRGTC